MSDPDGLPLDSDTGPAQDANARQKPVHLSWESIGLVAAGGIVGTGLRYLITVVSPRWSGVPVATFAINIVGAFLLGVLLELLAERSIDAAGVDGCGWPRYRRARRVHHLQRARHRHSPFGRCPSRPGGRICTGNRIARCGRLGGRNMAVRGHLRPALVDAMNQS